MCHAREVLRLKFPWWRPLWKSKLSITMRQTHVGEDKLFVDYAGDIVPVIVDRLTGGVSGAIFVAVMGASSFSYVEGTSTQTLGHWIGGRRSRRRRG
jgi:transposase